MSNAEIIAKKLCKAEEVRAYHLNEDGSRGAEIPVSDWNTLDPERHDFDLDSLRLIESEEFDLWYNECEEAEITGDSFKIWGMEIVVTSKN